MILRTDIQVCRAGDTGDAMFLIEQGRVRISIKDEDGNEITLAELARGDFFGEMSLIDGRQAIGKCQRDRGCASGRVVAQRLSEVCSIESGCCPGNVECAE